MPPGTTNGADQLTVHDEGNAAAGCDNSIESNSIIKVGELDAALKDLGFAAIKRRRTGLVFRNINGGELRSVHTLEGNEVAAGIDYGGIQLPVVLIGLSHGSSDRLIRPFQGYRSAIRHVEGHLVRHDVEGILRSRLLRRKWAGDQQRQRQA